jgi:NAD dependent epimerase/dehydratase family enzyme
MSWVSLEDLIGIYHYLIYADSLSGPVNATAPEPVTNRIFTKTLGRVLKRPALFPLPSFAVKGIFGEMGEALLLEGQRVKPKKLLQSGFGFLYPGLDSSLRWELGK